MRLPGFILKIYEKQGKMLGSSDKLFIFASNIKL